VSLPAPQQISSFNHQISSCDPSTEFWFPEHIRPISEIFFRKRFIPLLFSIQISRKLLSGAERNLEGCRKKYQKFGLEVPNPFQKFHGLISGTRLGIPGRNSCGLW